MNRPNFLLFLADDQGYGDAGCYGATDIETPNTDRLASEGARCTQWYGGGPLCSPSRAALLSGRFAPRSGVQGNVVATPDATGIAEETVAIALQKEGYRTWLSGKWHLGQSEKYRPHNRGFDEWFGFLFGCVDYYSHISYWRMAGAKLPPCHDLWHNNVEQSRNGEYIVDLIVEHALEQLREAKRTGQPFFGYIALPTPHYPMHSPPDAMARFAHLPLERQLTAAMLWVHDQALGRVLDELDALGLTDDTCVFVSSDHGPSRENRNWPDGRTEPFFGGSTGGLRGQKGSLFEGGLRLPAVVRWPGVIRAGTVADGVGTHMDIFPTLVQAAGGDVAGYDIDGRDALALWQGESGEARDLFWRMRGQLAVRRGDWKLTLNGANSTGAHSEHVTCLVNVADDSAESHDLSREHPELFADMERAAMAWRSRMDDAMESTKVSVT